MDVQSNVTAHICTPFIQGLKQNTQTYSQIYKDKTHRHGLWELNHKVYRSSPLHTFATQEIDPVPQGAEDD